MEPELKAKWMAALKGGKYEQGKGNLFRANRYCCLGVLCEVANREDEWRKFAFQPFGGGGAYGVSTEQASALAEMNDNGKPFAEIADYIEAKL